jgi:hypothetical protein
MRNKKGIVKFCPPEMKKLGPFYQIKRYPQGGWKGMGFSFFFKWGKIS